MNIALIIEYDGTEYYGFQIQNRGGEVAKDLPTIQGVLNTALSELLKEKIEVVGCSRTDAGVHAKGYCASFLTQNTSIPPERIAPAIGHLLPKNICVKKSYEVAAGFHARFDTKGKTYRYLFYTAETCSPILDRYAWHIKSNLDLLKMQEAVSHFVGTHEFDCFMASGGADVPSTIRTIHAATVTEIDQSPYTSIGDEKENHLYCFEVTGDGFLYNMVRIMTGTAVYAGMGKISPDKISEIISLKDRTKAGITAPPHGLYLYRVFY